MNTEAKTHALAFDRGVFGDIWSCVRVVFRFGFKYYSKY